MEELTFPTINHARRASVADVVQHVVQSTVSLSMAPGDRFPPERKLSEMLGVGRSPLREALKCLDILGFIEIRQGDGTYLAANASQVLPQVVSWGLLLGTREAQELIEARYFVEVTLASLAADRRTPDIAEHLMALVADMAAASSPAAFAAADTEFHLTIAHAARNPPLASVLESVKSLLDIWVVRVVETTPDRDDLVAQHRQIAEAIVEADPEVAATRMSEHIESVTALLQETISANPEGTDERAQQIASSVDITR